MEKAFQGYTNNLPVQLTSFIGREQELKAAQALLENARLLTLTGPGGTGKSRLAQQLAAQTLRNYPDGTWLVELAPLKESRLVAQAIVTALNLPETGSQSPLDRLQKFLASKTILLLLDNCEHLVEECARVVKVLLTACPNLKIVATSRETLAIEGEVVYRVPSMRLPGEISPPPSPDALLEYEGLRLFIERARAVQPFFNITGLNATAIIQLCRRLDGLPLALELAAARLGGLTIEQLTARLDDRFRLLALPRRETSPRQKTLKALVDWSYDLLSPAEQTLLRRLAVFTGGWSLEAVEEVAGFAPLQARDVLELLLALINKSLVQMDLAEARPRYSFLETIQQYSREKLNEAGEEEIVRERHFACFLQLARQVVPQLDGPGLLEAKAALGLEQPNFRQALAWSLEKPGENKPASSPKLEKGLQLAGLLWRYWQEQSLFQEGLYWLGALLEADSALPTSPALADAVHGMAVLSHLKGEFEKAVPFHLRHLEMRRELNDRAGLARALCDAGWGYVFQNDPAEAQRLAGESLALSGQLNLKKERAAALYLLGVIATHQEDGSRVLPLLEESLVLWREIGHPGSIAAITQLLGFLHLQQQDYKKAEAFMLEGLEMRRREGSLIGIMAAFQMLGLLYSRRQKWAEAAFLEAVAERQKERLGIEEPPIFGKFVREAVEESRAHMDPPAFEKAFSQGKAVSIEEAIEAANSMQTKGIPANSGPQKVASLTGLSTRELEVLELVAEGLSNPQIAARLVLSPRTVDAHLRTIYSKLGVNSRVGAANLARSHHILDGE